MLIGVANNRDYAEGGNHPPPRLNYYSASQSRNYIPHAHEVISILCIGKAANEDYTQVPTCEITLNQYELG